MEEWLDEEILAAAVADERVVYTCNKVHFARLHSAWNVAGREHFGIIIRVPQRANPEQQLRALVRLRATYGEDISHQLLWARAR